MALFFDRLWFDAKLSAKNLSRDDLAASANLSPDELVLIVKDQMEVTAAHVHAWSALLNESAAEIAKRCGVSTPIDAPMTDKQRIANLEAQVAALERKVQLLIKQQGASL